MNYDKAAVIKLLLDNEAALLACQQTIAQAIESNRKIRKMLEGNADCKLTRQEEIEAEVRLKLRKKYERKIAKAQLKNDGSKTPRGGPSQ